MYPPVSTAGADLSSRGTHRRDTVRHLVSRHTRKLLRRYAEAGMLTPLSEATKTRKRHNIDKILTERGYLRGHGLPFRAGRDQVEVGSPLIYAGTHQFGAARGAFGSTSGGAPIPWGDIPARPFLGLSDDDEFEITELVASHLAR